MGWYPWSMPDEMIGFMEEQYERFNVPRPSDFAIDKIAEYVSKYVARTYYYPKSPDEAARRFNEEPPRGLTEPEMQALAPEIEFYLKSPENIRKTGSLSDVQLHLSLWAALLFCWSEQGEQNVEWYRTIEKEARSVFPDRASS